MVKDLGGEDFRPRVPALNPKPICKFGTTKKGEAGSGMKPYQFVLQKTTAGPQPCTSKQITAIQRYNPKKNFLAALHASSG